MPLMAVKGSARDGTGLTILCHAAVGYLAHLRLARNQLSGDYNVPAGSGLPISLVREMRDTHPVTGLRMDW